MSWIAVTDGRRTLRAPQTGKSGLVVTGSLVIETRFEPEVSQPQIVLDLARETGGWERRFRITQFADGRIFAEHHQGGQLTTTLLRIDRPAREAALRLTFSWSARRRVGVFTAETLDGAEAGQSFFNDPQAWPIDDIAALASLGPECGVRLHPSVTMLAVANRMVPVGLTGGIALGTRIDTPVGPVPVEELRAGQLVQTNGHGFQPLRYVVNHMAPALGAFAPVEITAPFHGLTRDMLVAPQHRLMIEGPETAYLFGDEAVLVRADDLARMSRQRAPRPRPWVRYFRLVLDAHVGISAGGAWVESMYLGDLADHPGRLATSALAGMNPDQVPRHTRLASPQLRRFEALALVSSMVA